MIEVKWTPDKASFSVRSLGGDTHHREGKLGSEVRNIGAERMAAREGLIKLGPLAVCVADLTREAEAQKERGVVR